MKKAILILPFLLFAGWAVAQTFELRLANSGNGMIAVEMRETSGAPPKTSDIQTDLVFGICWDKDYKIDLGTITTDYTIRKAGPETVSGAVEYQQFAKDPAPQKFLTNWNTGQWVTLMTIPNSMSSNRAYGTFSVCPTSIQELNFNYNLVDYKVSAAGNGENIRIGLPLPKYLKQFAATLTDIQMVDLDWQILSDQDYTRYELEHAIDGATFHTFATVPAKPADQAESRYTYTHQPNPNGANYYRLKMIKSGDRFEYSPVRIIQLERKNDWSVTPNPSKGDFILTLEATMEEDVQLSVVEVSGKTIYQDLISIQPGVNRQTVRLNGVSSGMHHVNIRWNDGTIQTKNLVITE